ncbi:purine nucleoside permease [Streptomyces sp. F63]|uniref:purine-nucleoside phosphorylase n=1 Tax=Streptomyces sp. F63 TaxID=2824887 RepID=UPI001B384D1A|nr:purine nucleoside permease [Streptomyces sp. F63]MBQ0987314.1 purine nucleoside permease [Streptomyces sp. F63]
MQRCAAFLSRRMSGFVITLVIALAAAVLPSSFGTARADERTGPKRFAVGVLVITAFDVETRPWLEREHLPVRIDVPGAYRPLHCDRRGLCVAETGRGKTRVATSMTAILSSPRLDFRDAHFMSAGIAGTPPDAGTLGFAAWARWVVDWDLGHHVLPKTAPDIPYGYLPVDTGTNAFRLNDELVTRAYELTKDVELADSREARELRRRYPGQAGRRPYVDICDTIAGDDYWAGRKLSETAQYITDIWTHGQGEYCTTQSTDTAVAAPLAAYGHLDRYLSLRTASNFDQPYPGQTIRELLTAPWQDIAVENAYRVGSVMADDLLARSAEG